MAKDKYDIKCILFHIGEKGKTSHKAINYPSFVETLNKPVIQQRLKDGLLLGLLTHCDRDKARQSHIPHHDMVMRDPDLCNILRKVTTKDGVVYGYMDLTDTEASKRVRSLWKQGCKLGVSISTELVEKDEFFITDLLGVDITLRPEFDTPILEGNFSELQPNQKLDTEYKGFSVGEFTVDSSETVIAGDFSEGESDVSNVNFIQLDTDKPEDFSVREYLRERSRKPAQVLKARIRDVIAFMRMSRVKAVQDNRTFLRRYILQYVNEWVMASVNDPKNDLNIAVGLRLTEYCENRRPMRELQLQLKRARSQITSTGAMSRDIQSKVNTAFSDVMKEIYNYINSKVNNEDKRI